MSSIRNSALTKGTALVTGATSGIGRATALHLARDGWEVIVHGRNVERGTEVVRAIEAGGGHARFAAANLSDVDDVRALVAQVEVVDALVNNAGASWFGPSADIDEGTYDDLFNGNVRSAYFLVAGLAPRMAERSSGSIITIASMAGQIGLAGGAAYGATKAALISLTRSWAAEFSPRGVRVNAVAAGRSSAHLTKQIATINWARRPCSDEPRPSRRSPTWSRSWLRIGRPI
jgi:NAD(P)-dependent dehydrogenase (short-subunit alcohol dehydrogenase family)